MGERIMDSRTYYYARVSSKEQNLDRQIAAFKTLGATDREIIPDKESGRIWSVRGTKPSKTQSSAVAIPW